MICIYLYSPEVEKKKKTFIKMHFGEFINVYVLTLGMINFL